MEFLWDGIFADDRRLNRHLGNVDCDGDEKFILASSFFRFDLEYRILDRLPLHVRGHVSTTTFERRDVVQT